MTTPINNFQDILDAMDRDPALRDALRRHILTDELMQVPARLGVIEEDITAIKEDVSSLKEGQARLEEGQARMEGEINTLKEGQAGLDDNISELRTDVGRIGGDVSRLTGADYESHVAAYVHRALRRSQGINASVFSTQQDKTRLTMLLDEAETHGLLEPMETDELDRADMVLTTDGPTDYLLAEISITIQQDDIDRAADRARLLAKATSETVTAFAIGTREDENLQKGEVQVLIIPDRRRPATE